MTDTMDLTGRKEAVETAIQGGRSLWDDARARLFRNKAAVVSMWVLGVMVFIAALGPFFWVHDYRTISSNVELAPTFENLHLLGTDTQGRDHWSWAEMAIDEDAKFLGLRVHTTANLGGYLSTMSCLIPTAAHAKVLAGVYDIPVMYLDVHGMLTNTTPVDAYRGAGRPEAIYLIERLVNRIAMETGLGPDEVRRRNFIKPEQLPYKTSTGETYDSGAFRKVMERALDESDWSGFEARKAESAAKGLKRGRGICYYVEATAGMPEESAAIRFEEGGNVTVLVGTQSNGQGHETAFTQLICDRLGIDAERISIVMGDTDEIPSGGGTGGSRSLVSTGTAIHAMSDSVIEKGKQAAAQLFETNAVDIEFNDGTFEVAGTDRKIAIIALAEEAAKEPGKERQDVKPNRKVRSGVVVHSTQASSLRPGVGSMSIFRKRSRTVCEGWAPTESQYAARSALAEYC